RRGKGLARDGKPIRETGVDHELFGFVQIELDPLVLEFSERQGPVGISGGHDAAHLGLAAVHLVGYVLPIDREVDRLAHASIVPRFLVTLRCELNLQIARLQTSQDLEAGIVLQGTYDIWRNVGGYVDGTRTQSGHTGLITGDD